MSAPLLEARDLHVAFRGVKAADGVDLHIDEQEFLAIIGPNGSGKTTFLNLCTGYVRPQQGSVHLDGVPITRLPPRAIARRGVARAFQVPQLFTSHSVLENLMLATAARGGIWQGWRPLDRPEHHEAARELLNLFNLDDIAHAPVVSLSEGRRKLIDIAVAMALRPRLLLLDEPTSGVSAIERFVLMDALMSAMRQRRISALFVEHDMEVVEKYANRVVVWNAGRVLVEGPPAVVMRDPRVIETVIGTA